MAAGYPGRGVGGGREGGKELSFANRNTERDIEEYNADKRTVAGAVCMSSE